MPTRDLLCLLDCVALSGTLDGILVYNASGASLEFLAAELTDRLRAAGAPSVDHVWLGAADTEDSLWGNVPGPAGWGGSRGLLVPPEGTTRIVIVPDLSRLSLAAARAGVMMLGSGFVHAERRGQSRVVPTRHRWLAALAEDDRAAVSRHLLDRFAVCVKFIPPAQHDRVEWLTAQLRGGPPAKHPAKGSRIAGALPSARIAPSAVEQAIAQAPQIGMRSAIVLLRVAEAMARLDRKRTVDRARIRAAAAALGFTVDDEAEDLETLEAPRAANASGGTPEPQQPVIASEVVTPVADGEAEGTAGVRPAAPTDTLALKESELDGVPVPLAAEPSKADAQPGAFGLLRLPWHHTKTASSGHGAIIGTRRTDSLNDLAITETLLAAAPFQPLRRKKLRQSHGFILRRVDLRSYRRSPPAGDLLVLVLDYTSVAGRDWLDALVPFLADAYAMRAELCVVRVGASKAANPYRADRVMARNVLVPSVAAALDQGPGRASPLADGLALAFRTIRQTLGHGRSTTRKATLIVVTDGRGNVPLGVSREGRWLGRVGRQGIDDARQVARQLRDLAHVRRVLIDPLPDSLRDLPLSLAAALNAEIVQVRGGNA